MRYDAPAQASMPRVLDIRQRLRHRGPDGEGEFAGGHAALGHTRLALIDAGRGAQPMSGSDGRYTIVHNGEIYNFRELRDELQPQWSFLTDSDTEVLLAAYAKWGADCVHHLNGMFAFFVWDERRQEGFAARDLLGIKPLAYAVEGPALVFASEAQAIATTRRHRPAASLDALLEHLVAPFFSGVERPMFADVEYLQPGHALRISRDGVQVEQWGAYDLLGEPDDNPRRLALEIAQRLERGVERCLIADEEAGVFLSGGVDSSLIAALASRNHTPLHAFTIRFSGQDSFDYQQSSIVTSDDTPFAGEVARRLCARQTVVHVDRSRLPQDIAALAAANDAIPAWEQELAQHHLAREAARHRKAVLVGDAADETHFGYGFLLDPVATRSPAEIIKRLGGAPLRRDLLSDPIAHFDAKYRRLAESAGHDWSTPRARTLATTQLIVSRWLPRLLHNGDIHTMAFSLEGRVPFGDRDLLAIAARVDPRLGCRDGVEKWLLRQSARGIIPESIRTRPKSALPKDQGAAPVYQREARRAVEADREFLGRLLDLPRLLQWCHPDRQLRESECSLLFRVIALSRWRAHFGVKPP